MPDVRVAYETFGEPRLDAHGTVANAVLVLHALTGDAHLAGPAGPGQPTPGWWDPVVGPGRPLDTDQWFIVAANVLGGCQGTTGPSSLAPDGRAWGSRFPRITVRDQVSAEALLADALGIDRFVAVIGGSMGGMRSLEWAVMHPSRVGAGAGARDRSRRHRRPDRHPDRAAGRDPQRPGLASAATITTIPWRRPDARAWASPGGSPT